MTPRLPRRLIGWLIPAELRQSFFDDLDEAFADEAKRRGHVSARVWYWRQALAGLPALLRMQVQRAAAARPTRPRGMLMETLINDVRYAFRGLHKAPGFTAAAVFTLALGIGANTAIFTVAWRLILQPLPYPSPDRLVQVWEQTRSGGVNTVAPGNFLDWQRESRSFDAIAAFTFFRGTADLTGAGDPEQLEIRHVTPDYFRVFGVQPIVGRGFDADEVDRR